MNPFDDLIWAYRAVFKQTNAGGGNVLANFLANERTVLLYGTVGPDTYGATRETSVVIKDAVSGNIIGKVMFETNISAVTLPFPDDHADADIGSNQSNWFSNFVTVGRGDVLVVQALALALNEELTIAMRCKFKSWPPTVSTTGSTGTVTTTTTYDKVI